jgi:hypothetical protein
MGLNKVNHTTELIRWQPDLLAGDVVYANRVMW